ACEAGRSEKSDEGHEDLLPGARLLHPRNGRRGFARRPRIAWMHPDVGVGRRGAREIPDGAQRRETKFRLVSESHQRRRDGRREAAAGRAVRHWTLIGSFVSAASAITSTA